MSAYDVFIRVFYTVEMLIIIYVAVINIIYLGLMILGYFALRAEAEHLEEADRYALLGSPILPKITVIAPAFNEATTCRDAVRAMLTLRYPNYEVIVVNDGSTDETLNLLVDEFKLYRSGRIPTGTLETKPIRGIYESREPIKLVVIDKENGGKSDSLNAGINVARSPLICAVDADSLIDYEGLLYVARPFLEDPERTIACGGSVRVVNGCKVEGGRVTEVHAPRQMLVLFQIVEYLRAFLGGRVSFSFMNSLMLISGAFGLFRRDAVLEAGGYRTSTVGEDMELVVRLHRLYRTEKRDYRIVFVPEPVCWTEVPETLEVLQRQRNRWQRGTVETVKLHKGMLFNPRFGNLGMFTLPYFTAFEMFGPSVELLGYILTIGGLIFGLISVDIAILFFVVSVLYGIMLSMSAVILEELTLRRYPNPGDVVRLFVAGVVESLGYRQLLTLWRTRGVLDGLSGKKGWGRMDRKGFRDVSGGEHEEEAPPEVRVDAGKTVQTAQHATAKRQDGIEKTTLEEEMTVLDEPTIIEDDEKTVIDR